MRDLDTRDKYLLLIALLVMTIAFMVSHGRYEKSQQNLKKAYELIRVKDEIILDIQSTVYTYEQEINELYNKLEK